MALFCAAELIFAVYIIKFAHNKNVDHKLEVLWHDKTFFYGGKYFEYDEEYALQIAMIIYNRTYNKKFSKSDFIIENSSFAKNKNVWKVCLKEPHDEFYSKKTVDTIYDGHNGLYIDKTSGAVIATCGDKYPW